MADIAAIKKQLEFYFSDSNFRKDNFLRAEAEKNAEGYVPISTLLTFNKLKALTTDANVIKTALEGSEIAVVSEDGASIRRLSELPVTDSSQACTLYVKGYPEKDADVTIESVGKQFSEYGKVLMVRLRKDPATKEFKGSAFIEFDSDRSVAAAVAAANVDGAVTLSFKDTPFLCVMPVTEWLQNKANKKARRAEHAATNTAKVGEKRKRDGATNDRVDKDGKVVFTPGLIIKITNIASDATLYEIKDAMKVLGDLKYVEYVDGSTTAIARFGNKESADAVVAKVAAGTAIKEGQDNIACEVLEGEAEIDYWTKIGTAPKGSGGRGGGRGSGRGGRGRGGGRGFKRSRN